MIFWKLKLFTCLRVCYMGTRDQSSNIFGTELQKLHQIDIYGTYRYVVPNFEICNKVYTIPGNTGTVAIKSTHPSVESQLNVIPVDTNSDLPSLLCCANCEGVTSYVAAMLTRVSPSLTLCSSGLISSSSSFLSSSFLSSSSPKSRDSSFISLFCNFSSLLTPATVVSLITVELSQSSFLLESSFKVSFCPLPGIYIHLKLISEGIFFLHLKSGLPGSTNFWNFRHQAQANSGSYSYFKTCYFYRTRFFFHNLEVTRSVNRYLLFKSVAWQFFKKSKYKQRRRTGAGKKNPAPALSKNPFPAPLPKIFPSVINCLNVHIIIKSIKKHRAV